MAIAAASVPSWYSQTLQNLVTPELRTSFHQEQGLKCHHRCFGTLLVLRGDGWNGHATTQSLLYADWKHLLQWMSVSHFKIEGDTQSSFHQE
eukprot:scaffold29728_cov33-Cyclotella_meneghiniana.AAC.1